MWLQPPNSVVDKHIVLDGPANVHCFISRRSGEGMPETRSQRSEHCWMPLLTDRPVHGFRGFDLTGASRKLKKKEDKHKDTCRRAGVRWARLSDQKPEHS